MRDPWVHIPPDDDSYDPDMSVDEALRMGLIVVINGMRRAVPDVACHKRAEDGTSCIRQAGHPDVHTAVKVWQGDPPLDESDDELMAEYEQKVVTWQKTAAVIAVNKVQAAMSGQVTVAGIQTQSNIEFDSGISVVSIGAQEQALEKAYRVSENRASQVYGPTQKRDARFKDRKVGKKRR